jgi:hypothetical protein
MGIEEMAYQKAPRHSAVPLEVIFSPVYVVETTARIIFIPFLEQLDGNDCQKQV